MKPRIRVLSNLHNLHDGAGEHCSIELTRYPTGKLSPWGRVRFWLKSFRCDYVVMNNELRELLQFGVLKYVFPFNRCRLVSVDTILGNSVGVKGNVKRWVAILLLKKVHRHLLYFKDTTGYSSAYRIEKDRFRFIPFKINSYDKVVDTETTDEGFIFAGGYSRRDYTTLLEAVKDLPYPVAMVSADKEALREHGSLMDEDLLSDRVTVLTEYDPDRYIETMAASRLVVVPLRHDILNPAGTSTFLDAMALGKCVIVSSGTAVDGVLTDDMAIMVTPGDPEAMKEAIEKAYNDSELRQRIAEGGYSYAIKLGGEERLMESIVEELLLDYEQEGRTGKNGNGTRPARRS